MGDITELWNQTPDHSWAALHKTLEGHRGKAGGIEDYLVDAMLKISKRKAESHEKYPDNPQQLYDVINEEIRKMPDLPGS